MIPVTQQDDILRKLLDTYFASAYDTTCEQLDFLKEAKMARYTNNHTHLTGAHPEKLLDFYTRVMGGKLDREFLLGGSHKAWDVNLGGLLIRISDWSNADGILMKEYTMARGKHQFGLHHLAMTVDNMDEAYAELKANGAEFLLPPKATGPTSKVAFVVAPENVLVELIERK